MPEDATPDTPPKAPFPATSDLPLEIREIRFVNAFGVRAWSLRTVPVDRIEAAVNIPAHRAFLDGAVLEFGHAVDVERKVPHLVARTPSRPPTAPELKLAIPDGFRKPDSFYRDVADRYLWLASTGSAPAQELARANSVPTTTVHRWVRESKARRLLLLPPVGTDRA